MPKEKMWVEWDDGSHLSRSAKKPGQSSPLTREEGTNQLGQVTLSEIDESENVSLPDYSYDYNSSASEPEKTSEATEALAAVLSALILVGADRASPHVKRWWSESGRPTVKATASSARDKFAKTRKSRRQAVEPEPATFAEVVHVEPSRAVESAPSDGASMSSEEARQRLVAAFMANALSDKAKAFSDEQLRVLLNARIEDDADLRSSLENLSPQEVEAHINLMLEANPSFIAEFELMFWGRMVVGGQSVPLRSEERREPLPPPRTQSFQESLPPPHQSV